MRCATEATARTLVAERFQVRTSSAGERLLSVEADPDVDIMMVYSSNVCFPVALLWNTAGREQKEQVGLCCRKRVVFFSE